MNKTQHAGKGFALAGRAIVPSEGNSSAAFDVFTEELAAKTALPAQRLQGYEQILFVHKGQAHATLGERGVRLLPGTFLNVKPGEWCAMKNTGTGPVVLSCVSLPGGLLEAYRRIAAEEESGREALARELGVETAEAPAAPQPRKRARRGKSRRSRSAAEAPAPAESAPAPAAEAVAAPEPAPAKTPAEKKKAPAAKARKKRESGRPEKRRGSGGRAKEVYMDGKWVVVSGDKPFIALGESRKRRGQPDRS